MGQEKSTRLSYSSSRLLQACEQRYFHYKVKGTKIDADADDSTEAFDVGKAFHEVLENNFHNFSPSLHLDIIKACKKYNVEHNYCMITAMVIKYVEMHKASKLKAVICEQKITSPIFVGYVDALMVDEKKKEFWVVDLKTAGRWSDSKLAELADDEQLNLYAYFMRQVSDTLDELKGYKFAGCRYRVTTKLTMKQKTGESDEKYTARLMKSESLKSLDIVVPKSVMKIDETFARFEANYKRSIAIREGAAPSKNFGNCMSYFRPCEYWSQCHGSLNTKCSGKVICLTKDDHVMAAENEKINEEDSSLDFL